MEERKGPSNARLIPYKGNEDLFYSDGEMPYEVYMDYLFQRAASCGKIHRL